jgi:hypothetical protein
VPAEDWEGPPGATCQARARARLQGARRSSGHLPYPGDLGLGGSGLKGGGAAVLGAMRVCRGVWKCERRSSCLTCLTCVQGAVRACVACDLAQVKVALWCASCRLTTQDAPSCCCSILSCWTAHSTCPTSPSPSTYLQVQPCHTARQAPCGAAPSLARIPAWRAVARHMAPGACCPPAPSSSPPLRLA